jgi:hypothetical protein
MLQVSGWATMERALREVGYAESDIERMMGELMGAFKKSDEAGQSQWKKTREFVLRRRAAADAMQIAEEVEPQAVKLLPSLRGSKYVQKWVERRDAEKGKA